MWEIVVRGRLPVGWEEWFDGFVVDVTATDDGPVSHLLGPLPDQAALHGALARIRDLALAVVSVRELPAPSGAAEHTSPGT